MHRILVLYVVPQDQGIVLYQYICAKKFLYFIYVIYRIQNKLIETLLGTWWKIFVT